MPEEDNPAAEAAPVDVRAIRERMGLDQEAFAKRFGLPYPGFGEKGEILPPQLGTYFRLIDRFPDKVAAEVKLTVFEGWTPPPARRMH